MWQGAGEGVRSGSNVPGLAFSRFSRTMRGAGVEPSPRNALLFTRAARGLNYFIEITRIFAAPPRCFIN